MEHCLMRYTGTYLSRQWRHSRCHWEVLDEVLTSRSVDGTSSKVAAGKLISGCVTVMQRLLYYSHYSTTTFVSKLLLYNVFRNQDLFHVNGLRLSSRSIKRLWWWWWCLDKDPHRADTRHNRLGARHNTHVSHSRQVSLLIIFLAVWRAW